MENNEVGTSSGCSSSFLPSCIINCIFTFLISSFKELFSSFKSTSSSIAQLNFRIALITIWRTLSLESSKLSAISLIRSPLKNACIIFFSRNPYCAVNSNNIQSELPILSQLKEETFNASCINICILVFTLRSLANNSFCSLSSKSSEIDNILYFSEYFLTSSTFTQKRLLLLSLQPPSKPLLTQFVIV